MGATVSAKKNDDFDAMAAATGLNGAAPSANGSRTNDPKAVATSRSNNRNRGVSSSSGRVNLLLSITLFFALVHFFDPTIEQQHHDTDVLQNQFHHDPVRARLSPFSQNGADVSIARSDSPLASNGGRERIMQLLEEAGVANLTSDQLTGLPKWQQVVDLYGDKVVILGKEDCAAYRKRVPPARRKLGVAGMFNTGTNLLDTQMTKNIRMPSALAHLWQVPWGKHRMADVKWNHTAASFENADKENVLPVVMIRDPFAWLQSMCGHAYAAVWRHGKHHCPNLLPNEVDLQKFPRLKKDDAIPVMINFDKHSQNRYNSLVHLWSEWYAQYLEVDYPILMVRYEDLVFQPATVLREISDCVEGKLRRPIHYQLATSKSHGSGTDYIKALSKTADAKGRSKNMTMADLEYAAANLDARLMTAFNYNVPIEESEVEQ